MPVKANANCCCGGCYTKPTDFTVPTRGLDSLRQLCCACIPKHVCVTYDCDGDGDSVVIPLTFPCDEQTKYEGQIPIDGTMVTITLSFVIEDDTCYFRCESDYWYSQPADVVVDADFRAILCTQNCEPCHSNYVEFSVDGPCSGTEVIRVSPAPVVSVSPVPERCCGCDDPCDDNVYVDNATHDCAGPCGGCPCICKTACITVIEEGEASSFQVDMCDFQWALSNGMVITLVGDEVNDCCQLHLDTGDIVPDSPPADVPIGEGQLTSCPFPVATWEFTDSGKLSPDNDVKVVFTCYTCSGCDQVLIDDINCCVATLPRVLTATITGSCCSTPITVTLIYDDASGLWSGSDPNGWCLNGFVDLELACGADWTLSFSANNCVDKTVGGGTGVCEPVNLSFTVAAQDSNPGVGPFCCDPVAGGASLTVTITE